MKRTPKLDELAEACWNGACNTGALLRELARLSTEELGPTELYTHPDVPIIMGQINYLLRSNSPNRDHHTDCCGPEFPAVDAWERYKKERDAAPAVPENVVQLEAA